MFSIGGTLSAWPQPLVRVAAIPAPRELPAQLPQAPEPVSTPAEAVQTSVAVPILMYHYPPPDFAGQLDHLAAAGYTTVSLDDVRSGLHGQPLPAKPVVITFDDGYANQWPAFELLVSRRLRATFYVMPGGAASAWCVGAGRRYGDPVQPPEGCGDDYLSWSQIREIDGSGLVSIGAHTINHRNLTTLPEAEQRLEIQAGKTALEAQLGHSVRHFAYPYGAYDDISLKLVREVGYATAVTTNPGTVQPVGSAYTLNRVRSAWDLP